ncbi:MAG TPA: hypothetical protein VIQ26_01670 [Microbacteriaceae bacterium]
MTKHERTRQQLDPSSCLGAWPLTVFLAAAALTYALIVTVLSAGEITLPVLSMLSMVLLAAACAYVVVATSAYRAPFTSRSHTTVHLLVWAAVISSAASAWQTNRFARDDWWPVSFGLLLLALGPYRPARELAASGTVSALFLGFLTLLQFQSFATEAPPAAYVLVIMAPMLALCYASVAFSAAVVASLEDWHRQTVLAGEAMVDRFREGITRSVRQDRVTILGRDVLPYFSDILSRDTVTGEDRIRAREIADSIRSVMVSEVDRSWLEGLVDTVAGSSPAGRVSDGQRLAPRMTSEHRTIVRALVVALCEHPGFDCSSVRFALHRDGELCQVVLTADFAATARVAKALVAPYVAVMRVAFVRVQIARLTPTLEIGFSYEFH